MKNTIFKKSLIFNKLWDSTTLTTWGSFMSKGLLHLIVTPLIVRYFSEAESSLWFLFLIFIGFQNIADLGFGVTFIRSLSYAKGGANSIAEVNQTNFQNTLHESNWWLISRIVSSIEYLYRRLSILYILIIGIIGFLSLNKPISLLGNYELAWIAWCIILVTGCIYFYGYKYALFIQGLGHVALYRRWEAFFNLFAFLSNVVTIFIFRSLLYLVISNQFWMLLSVLRNRYIAFKIDDKKILDVEYVGLDKEVFKDVFPSAWRSWVGVLMSYGVVQASGIVYAQLGDTSLIASYLLALQILNMIKQFSTAPFYSKIPLLSSLYAKNSKKDIVQISKKQMLLSHSVFVFLFIIIGIAGDWIFKVIIKSNVEFPDNKLWIFLGVAFFIERFGAMHIQLYSLTNRIIWHIANGITGTLFILLSILLINNFGVYAFPFAYLLSNLIFYSWYPTMYSYKTFQLNFFKFEKFASLVPFLIMIIYSIIVL